MAANPSVAFDIGPLSWVKAEIEHSLNEVRTHLDKRAADATDLKAVKYSVTHLHQVSGALSMVGLSAATRYNEEIERLVATLDPNDGASANNIASCIALIKKAMSVLSAYLDMLMAGEPDRPMMLTPLYLAMNKALSAQDATESDLFLPDLTVTAPMPQETVAAPQSDMLAEIIKQRRAMYQAGLLKLLRDKDVQGGTREMRNATLAIEALQITAPSRSFWFTAGGFFDAVANNPVEAGGMTVSLFGKIDQQIKQLIDGVHRVPEKLFRDLLLVIGKSTAQTERIRKIRQLYRLDELLAIPESDFGEKADDELSAVIRTLRDHISAQKDSWLKFNSGNHAALDLFIRQSDSMAAAAVRQPNTQLIHLLQLIAAVGPHIRQAATAPSESQSLEIATALLFVESSLENYFHLSGKFSTQVEMLMARIKGAMSGTSLPALHAADTLVDDITRRAQERLLMFQVGQEIQVNLQMIESVLDAYFRDPLKVTELSSLASLFAQVQGALAILELGEAAALNHILAERIAQFASGALKGTGEDAETVAEGISALGLYISALQQGTAQPLNTLLPALIHFGLAEKPPESEQSRLKVPLSTADVDVTRQKVQELYEDWKQRPEQTTTRDQLRQAVQELKQESELMADSTSVKQSEEVLKAIDQTFDPLKTGISQAMREIQPERPTAIPAPHLMQLIDAPESEVDRELLDIFTEEASEVVSTIQENLSILRGDSLNKDALVTIRRGFHTLKGSGRMVGLTDLGEVSWQCEQVMNKWLKEEKSATSGFLDFVDYSIQAFSAWVEEIRTTGSAHIDGSKITRLAELLKNDRRPDFDMDEEDTAQQVASTLDTTATPKEPATTVYAEVYEPSGAEISATDVAPSIASLETSNVQIEAPSFEFPIVSEEIARNIEANDIPAIAEITQPPLTIEGEQEIRIGETVVQDWLFKIYLDEADVHAATLDYEMSAIEAKASQPVSHDFMRAAHTLTSSSRTTGFGAIAEVAFALEKWLQEVIEFPLEFDERRLAVTRRAVDALNAMILGLHSHEAPENRMDLIEDLRQLCADLLELKRSSSATSIRLPDTTLTPALGISSTTAPIGTASPFTTLPQPATFEAGKDRRALSDDVDADLLPIFLDEAREIIPQLGDRLRIWRGNPTDHAPMTEIARHLHTLKGSARMAGLMRLGELAHVMETKVIAMDQEREPMLSRFDEVEGCLDRFNTTIENLASGEGAELAVEIPVITDVPDALPASMAKLVAARAEIAAESKKLEGRERQALLRVNASLIDRFVNDAGELAIARSRIDQEMLALKQSLVELNDNVSRMRAQLREIEIQAESQIQSRLKEREEQGEEFDPLEFDRFSRTQELTRFLAESLNDVVTLQHSLQKNLDETEVALLQQSRLNRDLHQGLMSVRLVPLGNLQDRFHRLVRQTAKELGKKANLEFRGIRVEIDRSVLEKITAPLEHLLRNAVVHGLESPANRLAKGKVEIGEISIDAKQVGNEIALTLSDDGAGLDFARIRQKAIQLGLLAADADIADPQLTQFIFMSGFSTVEEITQIAGRGVGMDVVRNEIVSLGGRIDITSSPGKGTTFSINLPLTLAVTQAVIARVGETLYAIPSFMIEQVQEYKGKRYETLFDTNEIEWKNNRYPLRAMAMILGGKPGISAQRKAFVILARSGQQRAAVQVDDIIGNREIVVKTIGPQLARLAGISGATVMGNGQVVLIVNPVQLVYRDVVVKVDRAAAETIASPQATPAPAPISIATTELTVPLPPAGGWAGNQQDAFAHTVPLVMVVDDSLTVRKITSRILTREGFEVTTAKDGVDGLQQLQDIKPDIILLDIEMPRMDGFEFARNVRTDARTKDIPIIMITSRTADKHRNYAMELGVNECLGKPYQEDQLLKLIHQYTNHAVAA